MPTEATYDQEFDQEEKRVINDRFDLSMDSEKALSMEFIAFRREILKNGFPATDAHNNYMSKSEQEIYQKLIHWVQ